MWNICQITHQVILEPLVAPESMAVEQNDRSLENGGGHVEAHRSLLGSDVLMPGQLQVLGNTQGQRLTHEKHRGWRLKVKTDEKLSYTVLNPNKISFNTILPGWKSEHIFRQNRLIHGYVQFFFWENSSGFSGYMNSG